FGSDPVEQFATRYKSGVSRDVDLGGLTFTPPNGTQTLSHTISTVEPANSSSLGTPPADTPVFDHFLNLLSDLTPDGVNVAATGRANVPDNDSLPNQRVLHSSTLGYANHSYGNRWIYNGLATGSGDRYAGTPYNNFMSTINWFDRPFVSPLEIAHVPLDSTARMVANYGVLDQGSNFDDGYDPYDVSTPVNSTVPNFATGASAGLPRYRHGFSHLWNLLDSNPVGNDLSIAPAIGRILDYIDVPPPFDQEAGFIAINNSPTQYLNLLAAIGQDANSNTIDDQFEISNFGGPLNYVAFANAADSVRFDPDTWQNTTEELWARRLITESLRPPNNFLPPLQRSGRINLNTLRSYSVYAALMAGIRTDRGTPNEILPYADPTVAGKTSLLDSRRGFTVGETAGAPADLAPLLPPPVPADRQIHLHQDHATQFAGAFRPSSVSHLSPLASERAVLNHPLQRTLQRPDTTLAGAAVAGFANTTLLHRDLPATGTQITSPTAIHEDYARRSSFHRELPISRLSNLVSFNSDTYAIWATVGLFQLNPVNRNVTQEFGLSTGEVRRFRSFHIIDRGIPVKYQPGVANNVEDVILLSRDLP
ncbi:MAG: hypothetical protein AAF664_09495, partial [Planctomycetota bacterium]